MRAASAQRLGVGILLLLLSIGMSVCLVATCPAWHGLRVGGLTLPVHEVIPALPANLAAAALALAAAFWLSRSPASKRTVLICQKCNRVTVNGGQTHCECGGAFSLLREMKWVEGPPGPEPRPPHFSLANPADAACPPPALL
ncbi:MAG TPA: hypothetical protein VN765_06375 [Candidatus Acidoferrum sp.]|nr:hypothetical protein [Candidatus Acidoferrum sp.]